MAISKIQYDDKVAINIDSTIPNINKCNASDLNEIKSVVNNNADEIPSNDKLVNIRPTQPTDNSGIWVEQSKNLLPLNLETTTIQSLTITKLEDGKYKLNGTITTATTIELYTGDNITIPSGTYTSSITNRSNIVDGYIRLNNADYKTLFDSTHDSNTFTITEPFTFNRCYIYIGNNRTFDNQIISLQLEKGTSATTYEPYIASRTIYSNNNGTYEKLTDTINVGASINDKNRVNVLYSKNLFDIKNTPIAQDTLSEAGITLTFNNDGTITANGTNTGTYKFIRYNITLPAGTYYYSGCVSGGTANGYSMQTINPNTADFGNGGTFTLTQTTTIGFLPIRIGSDTITFNNAVFKPMIAKVPVTYNDYEPYITHSINVDGEEIYSKPVVLYNNNSGSNGNIDLLDNTKNYSYIKIFYGSGDQGFISALDTLPGSYVLLSTIDMRNTVSQSYIRGCLKQVNETTITNAVYSNVINYGTIKDVPGGTSEFRNENTIKIYKVLGFK